MKSFPINFLTQSVQTHSYLSLAWQQKENGPNHTLIFQFQKLVCNPFCRLIAKNVNVKRGLAIRHRDLANLTGENAERMVNRMGNGKKGKCCLHKLLNNWAMYVCLALIHSIGFPTDSSWKITPMICQKKSKSTATATLWHHQFLLPGAGGLSPTLTLGLRVQKRFLI